MDKQTSIDGNVSGQDNSFEGPGEYHFIDGAKAINRTDFSLGGTTLAGLVQFCTVMKDDILLRKKESHLKFSPRTGVVELKVGQHGGFRDAGTETNYVPFTNMVGNAKFTEDHAAVKEMMNCEWEAHELGRHIQKHRHLFGDREHWEKTVTALRTMKHRIQSVVENTSNDQGNKKKLIEQNLEDAPVINITFRYSVFEGEAPMDITVFVAYDVDGSEVNLTLMGANIVKQERDMREAMIGKTRKELTDVFGAEIPFIDMN